MNCIRLIMINATALILMYFPLISGYISFEPSDYFCVNNNVLRMRHFHRPTFSLVFFLFLLAEFIQGQLIQINTVQVPCQHLKGKHTHITSVVPIFTQGQGMHGASEETLHLRRTLLRRYMTRGTLVSVSMVRDHSVTSSSQQVRDDRTERRSSHRSLLM